MPQRSTKGVEVKLHPLLTSTLDGGKRLGSFTLRGFSSGNRTVGIEGTDSWVKSEASVGTVTKIKIPDPDGNRCPVLQPVTNERKLI